MKLIDNAAGVVAARHCRNNVVLASVENIRFHTPVRIGNLIIIYGKITLTSRSSMEVQIEVKAEDLLTGRKHHTLTAYFITIALDANGKSTGYYYLY